MNKNFILKKYDRVIYKYNIAKKPNDLIVDTVFDGKTIEQFEHYMNVRVKVLKVERPTYTAVYEEEILDEQEKKYLSAVIRPFRDRIKSIAKLSDLSNHYIFIRFKDKEYISFPNFKKNTMYKGMKEYKDYTLEELGL